MVSSSVERGDLKYEERIRRRAMSNSLYRQSRKDEARLAAQQAAGSQQPVVVRPRAASLDSIDASEFSFMSTEMAIRRGAMLALSEHNEFLLGNGEEQSSAMMEFDLTTITEDVTSNTTRDDSPKGAQTTKKKKTIRLSGPLWRRKTRVASSFRPKEEKMMKTKKKKDETNASRSVQSHRSRTSESDAWMCGCCGRVFSSFKAAEVHEEQCIRDEVGKLGWIQNSKTPGSPFPLDAGLPRRGRADSRVDFADLQRRDKPATTYNEPLIKPHPGAQSILRRATSAPVQPVLRKHSSSPPFDTTAAHHSAPAMHFHGFQQKRQSKAQPYRKLLADLDLALDMPANEDLLLSHNMRQYIVLSDEALVNVVMRATEIMLTAVERDAEWELKLLSRDKAYYDMLSQRALSATCRRADRFRTDRKGFLSKVQNKFADAYQLMKEGDAQGGNAMDEYIRKNKGGEDERGEIVRNDDTLYVNVMVKHSIRVVNNELERLAKQRWEDSLHASDDSTIRFDRFRAIAHGNLVKLAGLALASDFTPRRIAVQLSNDLYRLMVPQLKRRGVTIESVIEYRVGPYFVLAVNVKTIKWVRLMKFAHRDAGIRKQKWNQQLKRRQENMHQSGILDDDKSEKPEPEAGKLKCWGQWLYGISQLSMVEVVAQCLAWLYHLHWSLSVPICFMWYHFLLKSTMRKYILTTVTDEIFSYVEEKGMEMEIGVKEARYQAAFMLAALREMREDNRELKKKRQETESDSKGTILGPLLGPAISWDKNPAQPPPDFEPPENLEFVGLEVDLPVGFKRIRWAMTSSKTSFVKDAVFAAAARYENITVGEWTKHNDLIGLPDVPDAVNPEDFIGAEKETSYLMPKSVFVKANMAYETNIITAYDDHCFCIKKRCLTPEVPYGSTFVAWTQLVFINTGNNTCRLICSVEAEFPNGPPMVSRQIKSGMRAGTAELFVLIGETIEKYADEFP